MMKIKTRKLLKPWHMGTHMSAQRELFNEYQHDRVQMVFRNICVLVLWTKVASALEGLNNSEE